MKTIIFSFIALLLSSQALFAQENQVDVVAFIAETQQWKKDNLNMKMVWWIPTKYWEVSAQGNTSIPPEAMAEVIKSVENYTIIAGLNSNIGALGTMSADTVNITLVDDEGKKYYPLSEEEIPLATINLLNVLKPILASNIGKMGENMSFHVFPYNKDDGTPITDPESTNPFSVIFNEAVFSWKLPMATLVPKKVCPVDDEHVSGNWNYCPWHGKKLKELNR